MDTAAAASAGAIRPVASTTSQRFAVNLASNVGYLGLSIIVGAMYVPFLVRKLGPAAYGLIPLASSITSYMSLITLGLNSAVGLQLATNRVKVPAVVTMAMGLANLGLALVLAGPMGWGLYGIAAAGSIMLTLKNVFFTPLYGAHVLDKPGRVFFRELGAIVGVTSITVLLCRGVLWLRPITGWVDLSIVSLAVSALYGLMIYRFILSAKERELLSNLMPWRKSTGGQQPLFQPTD